MLNIYIFPCRLRVYGIYTRKFDFYHTLAVTVTL